MRQSFIMFAIVVSLMVFDASKSNAQIVINEIMASNTSTNLGINNKNFCDWIELYNYSGKKISIGNWYLTDNKTKPTKWKIPFFISIDPKGFKLFWCDGFNASNHTNFKLSLKGESVFLFNKDTILVDSISYPPQIPDISYGRVSGSMKELVYFQEATPMEENSLAGNKTLVFSGEPIFSEKAGFYSEPFKLELTVTSDNEKIYYTLDGSKPCQASPEYSTPIEITKNTIIRARAYSKNKLPGKVVTQTYLITESFSLPVISLATDPQYLWDENIGIYADGASYIVGEWGSANYFQDWERPIHVEYFDINGNTGFNIDAGVKIHGRSTRNYVQKSLAILAKEKYGSSTIPYELFGERPPDKIESFLLRNGGNDWGMTMFLDGFIHSLVNGKIDIDAQLYQPAIVFLNGEYWGIHNIREKINKSYIQNKYHNDSSKFDIIEANGMAEKMEACYGNMDEYNKMIEFIEKNDLSVKENYDVVKGWIDIDEFINYLATQVYVCNRDWPNSNMKFWKYRGESGKWRWILYDTELSCKGKNKFTKFNIFEHIFAQNSKYYSTLPWSNYLIRKLFENNEFKSEFIQREAVYLNTVFESEHVLHVLDSLKKNIEPEVSRSLNKWGGIKQKAVPYYVTSTNLVEWEGNINFIKRFVKSRPSVLRKNMATYFNLKDTVNLELSVNNPDAGRISLMGYTLDKDNFEGYVFADIPIRMEAIPNEGYEFVKWKGGGEEKDCVISLQHNKKITAVFRKIG